MASCGRLLFLGLSFIVAPSSSLKSPSTAPPSSLPPPPDWGHWSLCRTSSLGAGAPSASSPWPRAASAAAAAPLSAPGWRASNGSECVYDVDVAGAVYPGTALNALLLNGSFRYADGSAVVDPYLDDTLASPAVPDISEAGPDFFSFVWRSEVLTANVPGCLGPFGASSRVVLSLAQASYRVAVFSGGSADPVVPVDAPPGETDAVGMFKRHDFVLPASAGEFCLVMIHGFSFDVRPPDHYGNSSNTCTGCGQGGNHEIAQDLVSQDTCGWDWVVGTADRNSGLFDPVALYVAEAGVLIRGAAVSALRVDVSAEDPARADRVDVVFRVSLLNLNAVNASQGVVAFALPDLGAGAAANVSVTLPAASPTGVWAEAVSGIVTLRNVSLWWPHTAGFGAPALHAATAVFTQPDAHLGTVSATTSWRAGLRTITSAVDEGIGGQVFSVNGRRIYLQGGNWIATDAISRAESRGAARYTAEIALHKAMGLNVLRLWGGHGGHAEHLFNAADEAGVLLFHEFWMSGDNNGRWAGSYSWPLDHTGYLAAAAATVRELRGHASLLLYCGGNELWPLAQSPPADILAGLRALLADMDPTATFEQSSMGSDGDPWPYANFTDVADIVLAPTDGNYGINDEREWYKSNPGKNETSPTLKIGFQPEAGNTAHPDFESLARFLSPAVRERLPLRGAGTKGAAAPVDAVWAVHNYLPMTDGLGHDHLYALAPAASPEAFANSSEYSRAAGLVQYAQYQALFEGYQEHLFTYTSAIIMWKSSGPWPAFRGALYDFYLATSGGFFGTQAALEGGRPLHAQLSRDPLFASGGVVAVNKGLADAAGGPFLLTATAFSLGAFAELPQAPPFSEPIAELPAGSAARAARALVWPAGAAANETLLWRVELLGAGGALVSRSEYFLSSLDTDIAASGPPSLRALSDARYGGGGAPPLAHAATAVGVARDGGPALDVQVQVSLPAGAPRAALAVRASLRNPATAVTAATGFVDDRVLPQLPSAGYFSLLPGETRVLDSVAAMQDMLDPIYVRLDCWNCDELDVKVDRTPPAH